MNKKDKLLGLFDSSDDDDGLFGNNKSKISNKNNNNSSLFGNVDDIKQTSLFHIETSSTEVMDYKSLYHSEREKRMKLELDVEELTLQVMKLEYDLKQSVQSANDIRQKERMRKHASRNTSTKRLSALSKSSTSHQNEDTLHAIEREEEEPPISVIVSANELLPEAVKKDKKIPNLFDDDEPDKDCDFFGGSVGKITTNTSPTDHEVNSTPEYDAPVNDSTTTYDTSFQTQSTSVSTDERLLKQKARLRQQQKGRNLSSTRSLRNSNISVKKTSNATSVNSASEQQLPTASTSNNNGDGSNVSLQQSGGLKTSKQYNQWDSDEGDSPSEDDSKVIEKPPTVKKVMSVGAFDSSSSGESSSESEDNSNRAAINPSAPLTKNIDDVESIEQIVIMWARGKDVTGMIATLPDIYRGGNLPAIDFKSVPHSSPSEIRKYYL